MKEYEEYLEQANDYFHDIIRGVKRLGHRVIHGVEDPVESPQLNDTAVLRDMERGILSRQKIEKAPDYEKVSHNPSVKSLINHVDEYNAIMSSFTIPQQTDNPQEFMNQMAKTNGEVFSVMQQMQEYLIKEAAGYSKKRKRYSGVMATCAAAATNIRAQMDVVNKIQENCLYAIRNGMPVPYGRRYEELLSETNIFQVRDDTKTSLLGQGGINSVYKLWDNERGAERVLKEGHVYSSFENQAEISVYERTRIEQVNDPEEKKLLPPVIMNTAHRDVAVSIIDKLFNLNAAVDTSFVRSKNGAQASLMDKAAGKEGGRVFTYMDEAGEKRSKLMQQIQLNKMFLTKGPDYKLNEWDTKEREEVSNKAFININSAKFLESTYNLAALDIIVGHVDRHAGNMMVTEEGVKGIDNDSSFSLRSAGMLLKKDTKEATYKDLKKILYDQNTGAELINPSQAYLFFDKAFPCVTEEFRNKILGVSGSAVAGALKGLLQEDEIQACVGRVQALQDYLRSLPDDKVVQSFDQIDRESYSSQRYGGFTGVNTTIMSQMRTMGSDVFFDFTEDEINSKNTWNNSEVSILYDYVQRVLHLTKNETAKPVALALLRTLAKRCEEGEFDLEEALKSGQLDELCKMVTREVAPELLEGNPA